MDAVSIRDVSFSYGNGLVFSGLSLSLPPGQLVGLIGPNGSGKSTLLKLVSGVIRPGEGQIRLHGLDPGRTRRRLVARQVAMVPQQFHMPFAFTVEEVVMLGRTPFLRMLSDGSRHDREAVLEALEAAGAIGLRTRYFNELSGGERQKVILAMALAQQPQLLLLDEPTAHLDISHQVEILRLLADINRQRGTTIIASIHDLNLAAMYFERLILLHGGGIIADGSPWQVLTADLINRAYCAQVQVQQHPLAAVPCVIVMPDTVPGSMPPAPDHDNLQ